MDMFVLLRYEKHAIVIGCHCKLSQTFLTKEPIYNLTLKIYASFPVCVCVFVFFFTGVAN